jgi:predicted TIM-barrel fold metal-dependent hydrolase
LIDAHLHVACADTARYPRQPSGMGRVWWTAHGDADEVLQTLSANGIDRAVIVQAAGLYRHDCRCALDVAATDPVRYAVVGEIDPRTADPAADVARLAAAGARGVRVFGGAGDAPWLTDGRGRDIWAAAATTGLVVVPTFHAHLLAAVGQRCADEPAAVVALDHCAFVNLYGGPDAEAALRALAEVPSVHLKVSTHNLAGDDAAAWLCNLAGVFGADRLCWGSDFPQVKVDRYEETLAVAHRGTAQLDEAERAAFFTGTSARLWWPEVTP